MQQGQGVVFIVYWPLWDDRTVLWKSCVGMKGAFQHKESHNDFSLYAMKRLYFIMVLSVKPSNPQVA